MNERPHQISLPIAGPVSPKVVFNCRTMLDAIKLSIQVACLEPKEIYVPLEFDKGHWSKIMSGENGFPVTKLLALMDLTGNDIPLQWLAGKRGFGLVMLESEAERQIRIRDERLKKKDEQIEVLLAALQGRKLPE